ncbi:thioredoxin [Sporormia fimetaria CBS 119925]|uniref:Thioredoxin n=1 Tax=Sporormia fimetaria CBS 119925 TaxID=1340428 RepID=A0A6A6V9P9_9PLEO|nr:thioredoxin [Sporormia fimetaria CBS 119925]
MPTEISAPLHFRTLQSSNTYLIVDFYATWCPPCKTIAPVFNQLASTYSVPGKIEFAKVNVDEQREIAAQYGIRAMPTFVVLKNGEPEETVEGANPPALKKAIEKAADDVKNSAGVAQEAPKPQSEENTEGLSMLERLRIKRP